MNVWKHQCSRRVHEMHLVGWFATTAHSFFNTVLYYSRHLDASQFETFFAVPASFPNFPSALPLLYSRILTIDYKLMQNVFPTFLMKVRLQRATLKIFFRIAISLGMVFSDKCIGMASFIHQLHTFISLNVLVV